jgi:hypothetical protein
MQMGGLGNSTWLGMASGQIEVTKNFIMCVHEDDVTFTGSRQASLDNLTTWAQLCASAPLLHTIVHGWLESFRGVPSPSQDFYKPGRSFTVAQS